MKEPRISKSMYDKGTWQKNNYLEGYDEINERSFSFIKKDF